MQSVMDSNAKMLSVEVWWIAYNPSWIVNLSQHNQARSKQKLTKRYF